MPPQTQVVFVSSSRDMAEWSALTVACVVDFAARHGLPDLETVDYRDIDPAELDHSATWQDGIGAPSQINVALTVVLFGERLGTPLPDTFRLKMDIYERLVKNGHDWVHVPGMTPGSLQPDQVPLTGVLFEFFDAFLPRADGSLAGSLRVIFKGTSRGDGEPDFGNGEFRAQIETIADTAQRKRQLRREYEQQLEWMSLFWRKLYGLQQHANIFCGDQKDYAASLERILTTEFLAEGCVPSTLHRTDMLQIELPGPAPYDLERAPFFFGRGPQVAELVRRALRHDSPRRLVPVFGDSGSGKSSLLRAGLLNDALSPARRRLGWRVAFLSLTERPLDQNPVIFLAESLAKPSALPELGSPEALRQRLDSLAPLDAARRLLDIIADLQITRSPGLGHPRLMLVVDQLELALDGARFEGEEAAVWKAFLQTLAAMGDAIIDPTIRVELESRAQQIVSRLPTTVVVGLPADRFNALNAFVQSGDYAFPLPRLVDETALREVVTGTFRALGLNADSEAREALCRQAVNLALGTEASILPVLAVTLAALHDDCKPRIEAEAKWRALAGEQAVLPLGLSIMGVTPNGSVRIDIGLDEVQRVGKLEQAIARLGENAWNSAEPDEARMVAEIGLLPISGPRQKVQSGIMCGREFALAWLLRRLVAVSADDATPDRLVGLSDQALAAFARPLAEALRRHRLLTQHDDGSWWLVHQTVLTGWPQAAEWRDQERQIFRTVAAMEMDCRRWREDVAAGELDASRWLWTKERQVNLALEWMMLRGAGDDLNLVTFVHESTLAAIRKDGNRANSILQSATYFDDSQWTKAILSASEGPSGVIVGDIGSPLTNACFHGNEETVRLLMEKGVDPNSAIAGGWRPLTAAASAGSSEACDVLLAAGALVDSADDSGITPLMVAAQNGHDPVVARLMAAGADMKHESNNGATALILACEAGHDAVVARFLDAGADVNYTARGGGGTALILAAQNGHEAVVARLLALGADTDQADYAGSTALMIAAHNGHHGVVEQLRPAVVDIDRANNNGWTALTLAAQNGHDSVVQLLLTAGADPEQANNTSSTPLIWASRNGHEEIVERLLASGANPERAHDTHQTALFLASENGHKGIVGRLLDAMQNGNSGKEKALIAAARNGHEEVVARLLGAGTQRDSTDESGTTALIYAVSLERELVAALLLNGGADCNIADKAGVTALISAAKLRNENLTRLLLGYGADPSLRDNSGLSALDFAYIQEARPIVDLLLQAGVPQPSDVELAELSKRSTGMNIGLVVNARGKLCLVHDQKFKAIPIWVGYHTDKKQLEIFFDTGGSFPIDWEATEEMDGYLLKIGKILIIRMQDKKPIEGYDASFLLLKGGTTLDNSGEPVARQTQRDVSDEPDNEAIKMASSPVEASTALGTTATKTTRAATD